MANFIPFQDSLLFSDIASGQGTPLGAVPMDFATATPYEWSTDPIPDPDVPENAFDLGVFCSLEENVDHPFCINMDNNTRDDENEVPLTESERILRKMKKDMSEPWSADQFVNKYKTGKDKDGNPIYTFDPSKGGGFGWFQIFDTLFGGPKRREAKYDKAIKTLIDQTISQHFADNPLAFGELSGDLFTQFTPENYLKQVGDVIIGGSTNKAIKGKTVNELLNTLGKGTQGSGQGYQSPTQQVNSGQGGTPINVERSKKYKRYKSSLLDKEGQRDDTAYKSAIAKNIARNLADRDSKKYNKSSGSGWSTSLGGFYKGR